MKCGWKYNITMSVVVGLIVFVAFIIVLAWAGLALKLVRYSASKCAIYHQIRVLHKTSDCELVCAECALAAHSHNKV
jgi:hypothetical protein